MCARTSFTIIYTQITDMFNNTETSINYITIFARGTRNPVYSALQLIPIKRSRGLYTIINVCIG